MPVRRGSSPVPRPPPDRHLPPASSRRILLRKWIVALRPSPNETDQRDDTGELKPLPQDQAAPSLKGQSGNIPGRMLASMTVTDRKARPNERGNENDLDSQGLFQPADHACAVACGDGRQPGDVNAVLPDSALRTIRQGTCPSASMTGSSSLASLSGIRAAISIRLVEIFRNKPTRQVDRQRIDILLQDCRAPVRPPCSFSQVRSVSSDQTLPRPGLAFNGGVDARGSQPACASEYRSVALREVGPGHR